MINKNKGHFGPKVTARTSASVQDVRDHLEQSPRKSTRQLSQQVGISRASVRRIIHSDLKLFHYKVQILQAQTKANKTEHFEFGQTISERTENDPQLFNALLFSNEAHFHLSGQVKKQHCKFGPMNSLMNMLKKTSGCRKKQPSGVHLKKMVLLL